MTDKCSNTGRVTHCPLLLILSWSFSEQKNNLCELTSWGIHSFLNLAANYILLWSVRFYYTAFRLLQQTVKPLISYINPKSVIETLNYILQQGRKIRLVLMIINNQLSFCSLQIRVKHLIYKSYIVWDNFVIATYEIIQSWFKWHWSRATDQTEV